MMEKTQAHSATCHSGAYGGVNSRGEPIRKTFKFVSNNKDILQWLRARLTTEQLAQCVPLEGKEVTLSQH